MLIVLAEATGVNVATATKSCMPDDKLAGWSTEARRPETVSNIGASGDLYGHATQLATVQVFRSGDSIRPTGLHENGPAAPESRFSSAASTSNTIDENETRKPSSFTALSRHIAAWTNTMNAVAMPQPARLVQGAPAPQADRLIETGDPDYSSAALSLTGHKAGMRWLLARRLIERSGRAFRSRRLDLTKRRYAPNLSANWMCRRSLRRFRGGLSPRG
ncbi:MULTISPECIES: type 2 periplasmic-binding domain-containing protein [Bradyrhizobium]|uniref:Uncharacterized protein n=1 Tax=Bradyrhizobium brasilense TaxID=1419277 RepID=A0ABY8JFV3_9BRAD|nr:hypothetical protein [Bradyrhizobium brasilense]MCP3413436.1 hypothetical protein [Bradyrhizobium brasilense]WFU62853.1 hypothetical protein QA636_36390 [Bradyrhizobium brasilense]